MVAQVWTSGENLNYTTGLELMKQPPAGVRIQTLHPLEPLPVGAFTADQKQIASALELGHDEARQ